MRNRTDTLVILAAIALVAVALSSASARAQGSGAAAPPPRAQAPTSPVTGDAARGKALYFAYTCYACHGYNGETGARPFVPDWPGMLATEAIFLAYMRARADQAPVQPSTRMPHYSAASLTDEQARDIYAHIRTFTSGPPPLEKIPVFMQILEAAQQAYEPPAAQETSPRRDP